MFERIYSLKIFEGIEKNIIDNLINSCEVRKYLEDEFIMLETENGNGEAYIIKSGNVGIIIGGTKIAELGIGDIFGEMSLLNNKPRTATIKALTETKVYVLNMKHLNEIIDNGGSDFINKTVLKRIEENIKR